MQTIGFIGLGIMGSRMAENLLNANVNLVVFNRSAEKITPLAAKGATIATSPQDVGRQSDVVFTMLAQPQAVEAVALGADGVLAGLSPGSLWVDCSTTNPSFSIKMAALSAERNIAYIGSPVAGSKPQAADGNLVFFAGGTAESVARAQPYFDIMGQRTVHVGDHGKGIGLKVVINHLLGTSFAAFAEALALGEALGLSREMLLNALVGGPVTPPYLGMKKEKMLNETFSAEFPLRWMQKDMQMVSQTAYELGIPMPVSAATNNLFIQATQQNLGDLDFTALIQLFNTTK